MGLQLEPNNHQSTFDQHGPWHFGDIRFKKDQRVGLEAAFFQSTTIPGLSDRFRGISKGNRTDNRYEAQTPALALSVSKTAKPAVGLPNILGPSSPATAKSGKVARPACLVTAHPDLVFTQAVPSGREVLTFPLRQLPTCPRPCLKRRRPDTDVDGPNTASLSCKKRRLLRHLITSRLSQPFSLPATHILNREAVATGDKRVLKLAAIMAARRLHSAGAGSQGQTSPSHQPSPSTWLRRAAVINRFRQRVCAEAAERGVAQVADLAAKAAVFQQSHGDGAFVVGGRYLVSSTSRPPGSVTPATINGVPPRPGPPLTSVAGPGTPQAGPPTPTVVRIPSPRLRPMRSPELRVTRPAIALEDLTDLDDDDVAFPTSEHESRYEDDPEDVYADFGVIFGGGGDGSSAENDEGDNYEDYLDDLDGIPWNVRC